jgi:uncharacterized protein YegP (UPF0339 family)
MKLDTYEDNAGRFHWQFQSDDGKGLADSTATYGSRAEAQGAGESARIEVSVPVVSAAKARRRRGAAAMVA